jgi:hypothetical protein
LTTTLASTDTDTAIGDLVLVRMSVSSKKPVGPVAMRKDIGKLLGSEMPAAELDVLRNELASAGFLVKGKRNTFALTDAGRERALRFLGVTEIPADTNWSALIAKYLLPRACGLSPNETAKLKSGDQLAAFFLRRKYELADGAGSTVSQVLEALVCKQIGFGDETTLTGLLCAVSSRLLGSERLSKKQLAKQIPLFETGLKDTKAETVRSMLVRDWLVGAVKPHEAPRDEPFDLAAFAATVRALAAGSPPEDRFHDNKVFIAALWLTSQREPNFPRLALPEFKHRLLEANSQNLLHLSRADLVQAMDPEMVADSETEYLNATFHFVLVEGNHQ